MSTSETKLAAAEALGRLFQALDDRDWPAIRSVCADPINVDYPSKEGGAETISLSDFLSGLQGLLPGFDTTHHLMAFPVTTLENDKLASASVDVLVTHTIDDSAPDAVWIIGVRYAITLALQGRGWLVSTVRATVMYEHGNRALEALARERASAKLRS